MDSSLRETRPATAESPLIALVGPTGSGKSGLALALAKQFDAEIVNCDSLQIFRHFNIGTAKLPFEERQGIPHYLIDARDPNEVFTAGDYSRAGRTILDQIRDAHRIPLVVGGTGFYLRALIDGLAPGPERDEALRDRLQSRENRRAGSVHRLLRRFDPHTAKRIHPNDVSKVIRAVEICLSARKPAQAVFDTGRDALAGYRTLKLGLFPDREELYRRLELRVEQMYAQGLIAEVQSLLDQGYAPSAKPFESIGYKQALQSIKGELSPKDAVFYTKRATRQYAKRQMTWFRQEPGIEILSGFGDSPEVYAKALARMRAFIAIT